MPCKCFVLGCKSGYKSRIRENNAAGIKNPSIFSAPKDDQLFEQWKEMIPKRNKTFTSKDRVCELHFEEDCIETDYETLMPNGFLHKIPRGTVTLKKYAVPTIFPDVSVIRYGRKASTSKHRKAPANDIENAEIDTPLEFNDFFKFSVAVNNILTLLSSQWSIACSEDCVIFAKWNSEYYPERRVVICKDLSTKVFLMDVEISLSIEACTVENILQMLKRVDDFVICKNADSRISSGCRGFPDKKKKVFCSICNKSKENDKVVKRRGNNHILVTKRRKIVNQVNNNKKRNICLKKEEVDFEDM